MAGCGHVKYEVDYGNQKPLFRGAKDAYCAGEEVELYYDMIATDTDYSFFLDRKALNCPYENGKGYVIRFQMPAHGVRLRCKSRNSMTFDPLAGTGNWTRNVTRVHLCYDKHSGNQFKLDAWVEEIGANGAVLTIEKRVGPMNYTGVSKEGKLAMNRAQVDSLLEILSRYDIRGFSELRTRGYSAGPTRTLSVFLGEEMLHIAFDAQFPKTLPPQEDVMYCELFNFFNGLLRSDPEWKETDSPDLEDPRENPAYGARTVTHFGKQFPLVPGTAAWSKDFSGAEIDYGDRKWWIEEDFIGIWRMTKADRAEPYTTNNNALLVVKGDGSAELELDGERWTGTLGKTRLYLSDISLRLTQDEDWNARTFTVHPCKDGSYARLCISARPGPVPEPQFSPTSVYLTKQ